MNKIVLSLKNNYIPFQILYSKNNLNSLEIKWTECRLLSNYSEISKIIELKAIKLSLFLYFNKKNIHNILYDSEELISLNKIDLNDFSDYFYIDLLIMDEPNIINYSYSIEIIQNLNLSINEKNGKIKKIIQSKIVIDLINNYKSNEEYNYDTDENILNSIEKRNIKIIESNIQYFKELNLNYDKNEFLLKKIDEIYIEIIIELIKTNKFSDYEYIINVINQLNLESIYITKNIFIGLYNILKEEFIKRFIFSKIDDLSNIEIINFYFILFKYIIKNSIYLYHFPILLNTRIFILNNIKNNKIPIWILNSIKDSLIKERIDYIIKEITDSEYYFNKYSKYLERIQLKEICEYYRNYLFESKKDKIIDIQKFIENKKVNKYDYNVNDYEKAKNMNKRFPIIKYLFGIDNITYSENKINKYYMNWEILEKMIQQKKYKKIRKNIIMKLLNFFTEKDNNISLLEIFKEEDIQLFINKNIHYIRKEPENKISRQKKSTKLKNENINNSKIKENKIVDNNIIGDNHYIQSKDLINKEDNIFKENKDDGNIDINCSSISIFKEVEKELLQIITKSSKYKIIEYIKIIEKLKRPQYIKKLKNDYYAIGGEDNNLYIYDYLYRFIIKINVGSNCYDLFENKNLINKRELIVCSKNKIYNIILNLEKKKYYLSCYEIEKEPTISALQIDINKYIFIGNKGIIYLEDLFNNYIEGFPIKNNCIYKNSFIGSIRINAKIIALTSNNILSPNGEDKISFYDWKKNKIVLEIKGYSFIISTNGLYLVNNENYPNNKILLCACKKYNKENKNGILLINVKMENFDIAYHLFYDMGSFEVYCFCQISIINNENPVNGNMADKKKIKKINTNYFLVGGFHENRREGMIKLFKLVQNNNKYRNIKMEYIQDIIIENKNEYKGFEGPISSIIQSDIFGNILISCLDGNVYLFKSANIDFFLQYK